MVVAPTRVTEEKLRVAASPAVSLAVTVTLLPTWVLKLSFDGPTRAPLLLGFGSFWSEKALKACAAQPRLGAVTLKVMFAEAPLVSVPSWQRTSGPTSVQPEAG